MKNLRGKRLTKLWRDRMGGVFVYAAIAAPVLIGAAGLSIDVGMWYANKRLVQSAVDSAALAGALELRRSVGDITAITNVVNADALINGYSAAAGDVIAVDASNSPQVAVTITRTVPGLLSQVVFTQTTNVQARAVARADVNDSCIWSLNGSASGAVTVSGGANVELDCGVIANSSDTAGIDENGTGCLTGTEIKIVGNTQGDCVNPTAETGIAPVSDPLAALAAPSYTACSGGGPPNNCTGGDCTFDPGRYCTNISITTSGTATFNPGLYILDGAALTISGSSTVVGVDVSFYLTENQGASHNITISGGADVTLSAPSDGELPGILFYQDRNTMANITHQMTGGTSMQLNGIIYFPTVDISFTGGSSLDQSASIIIADEVTFIGEAHLGDFETAPGNAILGNALMLQATLVE